MTCLSTIEHIGFDNSQYDSMQSALYASITIEARLDYFIKLARLTSKNGNLLMSVPFGYREILTYPVTFKIASQIFDYPSLQGGIETPEKEWVLCKLEVYSAGKNGLAPTNSGTLKARYADGCPAARAVAFIKGNKGQK